jgi:hypothetical protein
MDNEKFLQFSNVRENRFSKDVVLTCFIVILLSIPFFILTRNLVYLIASSLFALFVISLEWYAYRWRQPSLVILHQDNMELKYMNGKTRNVLWDEITKIWIADNPKKSVSGAGIHYVKQTRVAKKGYAIVVKPEIAQEVVRVYVIAKGYPPPS